MLYMAEDAAGIIRSYPYSHLGPPVMATANDSIVD
jgi:hypothetical protein